MINVSTSLISQRSCCRHLKALCTWSSSLLFSLLLLCPGSWEGRQFTACAQNNSELFQHWIRDSGKEFALSLGVIPDFLHLNHVPGLLCTGKELSHQLRYEELGNAGDVGGQIGKTLFHPANLYNNQINPERQQILS